MPLKNYTSFHLVPEAALASDDDSYNVYNDPSHLRSAYGPANQWSLKLRLRLIQAELFQVSQTPEELIQAALILVIPVQEAWTLEGLVQAFQTRAMHLGNEL